uniref:Myriapod hemocyanin subunit type 1 n=1 Tax=Polydesmus angustus TaxID=1068628 RepID=I7HPY6_9MYRI|nr:myriapod hemocyanin subunit type 1 [Polydesmus angustus]
MKLILCLTLFIGVALADRNCPAPTNVEAKQAMVDNLLTFINKPDNPPAPVPNVDPSKLKGVGYLPKREVFSMFDEREWPEAIEVLKRFLTPPTFEEFIKVAETLYPRMNEDLFFYCFSVAIVNRPDAQGVRVPRVQDVYPDKFFEHYLLVSIKDKIMTGHKNPVVNDTHDFHNHYDPYRRVDYFTEDMGMNSHHYHWHVTHPLFLPDVIEGVHKDRIGELFYWMHRQMVARFDSELLSNHLPRVSAFEHWDEPIHTGYAPHLTIHRTGYRYLYRPDGLILQDLPELTKSQMQQWKLRILKAIKRSNYVATNGSYVALDKVNGIDTLAHLIISTTGSVNRRYYGNLHSYAHTIAGKIADASGKYAEDAGVMIDVTTSARDPIFYQWHKYIDGLFQTYQKTLKPYNKYELSFPGVSIEDVHLETESDRKSEHHDDHHDDKHDDKHNESHDDHHDDHHEDVIHTYWTLNDFKLTKGFDYTLDSEAIIHMKHIDHEDFTYVFDVVNHDQKEKHAAIRVFLRPTYDEAGHEFTPEQFWPLIIELDKFTYTLKPGHNIIRHNVNESSVTMPREQIYDSVKQWSTKEHDHCHCGWPEYMLFPKGNYEGMAFKLFVMVTDWDQDKISDDTSCHCKNSLCYCGTIFQEYPDKRPMGFPFDRPLPKSGWEAFRTPNMFRKDLTVKFTGYSHIKH